MTRRLLALALAVTASGVVPFAAYANTKDAKPKLSRDDPNYVICRREAVTGSLAQTRKVCMTRAEWVERSRGAQETGQRMQEAGLVNSCGASEPGRC